MWHCIVNRDDNANGCLSYGIYRLLWDSLGIEWMKPRSILKLTRSEYLILPNIQPNIGPKCLIQCSIDKYGASVFTFIGKRFIRSCYDIDSSFPLSLFPTLFSLTISFLFISSTLSSSSPSFSLFLSIPLYVLLSPKRSLSFSLAISFQAISFVSCHSFPSLFISIASLFPCLLFRFLFLSPLLLLCSSLQTTQPINFSYRVKSLGDCAVFISNVLLFYFQYENWMFRDIHKIVRANWSVCIFCIYVSTLDNDYVMSSIFFP